MKRVLALLAVSAFVLVPAGPVLAQTSETAESTSGSTLVMLAAIGAAIAMFLLIIILFGSTKSRTEASINTRLTSYQSDAGDSSGIFGRFRFLRRAARSAESAAEKRGATNKIEQALETADLPVKPGEAIVGAVALAVLIGILVTALTRSFIWGLIAGIVVMALALTFVNQVAARHKKRFEQQLPDTLNLIATSLRAGYSLLQAVEAVGEEAPEPTRREFGRAIAEIRLGKSIDGAMDDIALRMSSTDFEWTVIAINIQREVGGNLAEILENLAETIRSRFYIRRQLRVYTAQGRLSGWVLSLLPVAVGSVIFLMQPDYVMTLFTHPLGIFMVITALTLQVLGILWIRQIVDIEI